MKAFLLERYGKKRALRSAEVPTPELRDNEVLVEVHAAGVNLAFRNVNTLRRLVEKLS